MIIRSYSNIDIIQGVIGYGNATEGITDWRIQNSTTGVFNISNSSSIIRPSGGTSEIGEISGSTDRYMIFKGGTSTFTVPVGGIKCDILVVGGGGCGGRSGGGGGAVIYTQNVYFPTGGYSVKVGNGGISLKSGSVGDTQGANGGDSDILFGATTIFSAKGGGFGAANYIQSMTGGTGGSGGGSENRDNIPTFTPSVVSSANIISTNTSSSSFTILTNQSPNGITIYGNRGGIGGYATVGGNTGYSGGGGGGAGGVGGNFNASTLTSGAGGAGISINIIGTSIKYGSGGASGIYNGSVNATQGTSGTVDDGAGTGAYNMNTTSVFGSIPTPGRGGGGGGWGVNVQTGEQLYAKDGGSGIVIIRYYTANITIIDNGNVGIGITPITASSKLEIGGGVNISGIYKKNNRNVISDTSNYALTTSNTIIPRIIADAGHGSNYLGRIATQLTTRVGNTSNYIANISSALSSGASSGVSSQWTNVSSGIHYTPALYSITSTPVATTIGTVIGTSGIYTYQVFTYTTETAGAGTGQSLYTISVPTGGVMCDILVIGGGGGGGSGHGGGGGAGQLVLIKDAVLNQNYTIRVGSGGIYSISQERGGARPATKGKDSTFGTIIAEGGGACTNISADKNGGSGAGGDGYTTDGGTGGFGVKDNIPDTFSSGTVYSRGNDGASNTGFTGGGGGGAGVAGNVSVGGDGLSGINEINFDFLQNFGSSVGQYISAENKTYFAGGGGGGASSVNNISKGGGGIGGSPGGSGLASTGSGGGGGAGGGHDGGNGGSGIVIIRYLSSTRNVGIGTTNPTSELHVYDDTTTNTKLTIQNNNAGNPDIVITPSSGFTNVITRSGTPTKTYITYTFPINQYNLMAYYKFNNSSSLGLDSNPSATKYNLTPTIIGGTGGYNTSIAIEGGSFQATNDGDRLEGDFPLKSIYDSSETGISVTCWFYKTLATYDNGYNTWLFNFNNPSDVNQNITMTVSHYNNVYLTNFSFSYISGETYCSGFGPNLSFDTWYHIVLILTKSGTIKVYFNGINLNLVSGTTDKTIRSYNSSTYPLPQCPNTTKLRIYGPVGSGAFSGNIDEFYVFNKELTQTEIINLYNKTYTVPTNTWNVRFPTTSAVTINSGSSQNVLGNYTVSVGNNSSVIPADGQATTPYPSTAITSIAIVYEYNKTILPEVITTATGTTTRRIGDTDMCTTFTYTGTGTSTTYTFATTEALNCDILIVGGGGGGGNDRGGGGGGGGVVYIPNVTLNGTYTIIVGKEGLGTTSGTTGGSGTRGENGNNSSISGTNLTTINAIGGGGGGACAPNGLREGLSGGSGGGGSQYNGAGSGGTGTTGQGNTGGIGIEWGAGGGGGGAVAVGTNANSTNAGNGGIGSSISITGISIIYGSGGGGGGSGGTGSGIGNQLSGTGGSGGAGNGSIRNVNANNATINGCGGGGAGESNGATTKGGNGFAGIVIIRYRRINSSSLELITSSSFTEPVITSVSTIIGTKQYPETPSTTANNWTDNGFNVVSKTNSAILSSYDIYNLFENTLNTYYHSANLFNGSSPFNFTGSTSFKGVNGLSISIDLGRSIYIRQMRIAPWRDTPTAPLPGIFKIYASNDSACWNDNNHSSWIEIHSQTTSLTFAANIYTTFGNFSTINTPYRYFTMVVYNLINNYGWLIMSEWDILGIYNIAPVAINNDYKYLSFTYDKPIIEQKTGVGGWRLVRFLPPTATAWHPINDNLAGTTSYGTAYNNTNAWSIPFGTFDEFCFGTLNLQYWMYITKTEAIGANYSGVNRNIIKSSFSPTPYWAIQYYRSGVPEDPWISIRDHGSGQTDAQIVYGENSFAGTQAALVSVDGGMGVWVRNKAEVPVPSLPSQTSYTVNFPVNTLCDILVIGGGGGGGASVGGGGGAGGVVYQNNIILNGTYTINVGSGGRSTTTMGANNNIDCVSNGIPSTICFNSSIIYEAKGGGGGGSRIGDPPNTIAGWTHVDGGFNGGSGGGGSMNGYGTITNAGSSTQGNTYYNGTSYVSGGNNGSVGITYWKAGGGGGVGGVGSGMNGGPGIINDITGRLVSYAAGGGGGTMGTDPAGIGGSGIGGNGSRANEISTPTIAAILNGTDGTGSGGGGGGYDYSYAQGNYLHNSDGGGTGGSGIVIIRYRSTKIGNRGYNIGNYNGDFKIISSVATVDTDFMRITRDGASIYNPTGSPLWSTVSDRRIKENIEKASYDMCYESINKLELYRFSYIKELNNINKDLQQLGYIAQEVQDIFPKAVSTQEFHNENLSISDMLSIDITQINYSLYGAVKKLIEIDNNKEMRIKMIEYLLNIDDTSKLTLDTSNSNLTLDTTTSNLTLDISNSNIALDSSNSNIILDTTTSNITLDTNTSNITQDTSNSNIILDTSNSNITLDISNSNIALDTSNSNIILDISNSNITLDTTTSNLSN